MASSVSLEDHNCSCLPFNVRNNGHRDHHTENSNNAERVMMKQTEDLLASEMNKLSVQERTEALEDVHCVGEELKETPEMMENALADFALAVVVLLQKEGNKYQVYEIAVQQNRSYVEDDSFRLKFLRANFYDVERSVRQMMRFLQHKATYFGIDKVAKEITLDDLSEEDMEVLQSGMWHIQDGRDRSGRVILHVFTNMDWEVENLLRAAFMMFMNIVTADLEAQTKGIVEIYHNVARTGQKMAMPGLDKMMIVGDVKPSFPIRTSTTHYCFHQAGGEGNRHYTSYLQKALQILPLYETVRTRIHVGHSMELQYQLRAHGIPLESFPVDMDGKVREDILNVWLHRYHKAERSKLLAPSRGGDMSVAAAPGNNEMCHSTFEVRVPMDISNSPNNNNNFRQEPTPPENLSSSLAASSSSEPFVMAPSVAPSENDVLLGRGKFNQCWSGNVKFREFIEKHSEDYDRLPRTERQKRTIELTQALIATGIRFFNQDKSSGEWAEADFAEARLKVSTTFRTLRKGKPNVG